MGIYIGFYVIITIVFVTLTNYFFTVYTRVYAYAGKTKKKGSGLFVFIACALLICIIGFRSDHQGIDLYNSLGTGYFFYYHKINDDSLIEILKNFGAQKYANFEIGFVLFSKLIGTLCKNQQILLFSSALLAIAPMGYFVHKNSKNQWLSIILFMALPMFATITFSAIRQGIAIGIVLLSFEFVKEKKPIWFILTVAIACSFHSTAIVALVAYPVYHIKIDRRSALLGGVGGLLLVYLMRLPLFWILARLVHDSPSLARNNSVNLFIILAFIYAMCVVITKDSDYHTRGFLNIFWLACAAQAFSDLHNLAGRITWYFMPLLIVLVPNLLEDLRIKEKYILKPMTWVVGLLTIFLGLYYLKYNTMAVACPYIPFWMSN